MDHIHERVAELYEAANDEDLIRRLSEVREEYLVILRVLSIEPLQVTTRQTFAIVSILADLLDLERA